MYCSGGCSSSMLVDLFLYHYGCNYKNKNLLLYRYINNVILISTDNAYCLLPVEYPAHLTLTCNNLNNNLINFLDLKILLHSNKIFIDIYHKRKDFSFHMNTFTNYNSCLHASVYQNILLNHLFHIK